MHANVKRNPLGCAVAMTALDVLVEERLAERAERLGEQFRNDIRALRSPLVKEVRGRGLFNAVVIDESTSSRGRTAWQLCLLLKSRGLLAKPTHVNMYVCMHYLYPENAGVIVLMMTNQHPILASVGHL
jgi:acetylornithine/succinyldiaminopimelate/putrescine aminotransferase